MKHLFILFLLALMGVSTYAKLLVKNGLTHTHQSQAGMIVSGKIQIQNAGKTDERVKISKNDLMMDCTTNESSFTSPNSHARSLAKWLTTNVEERVLHPGEEYELLYSIVVPQDSTLHGSYWAVLMVEGNDPVTEQKPKTVSVGSKIRYAVQIITDINGEETPTLSFDKIDFKAVSDSVQVLKVKVKNESNLSVRPKVVLDLVNANGEKTSTVESSFRRLYPNSCGEYEVVLRNIPKGHYEGILMADYGQELFATNLDVDIK